MMKNAVAHLFRAAALAGRWLPGTLYVWSTAASPSVDGAFCCSRTVYSAGVGPDVEVPLALRMSRVWSVPMPASVKLDASPVTMPDAMPCSSCS